jgi:glutamate synthase (NADPH/NADH) small chain
VKLRTSSSQEEGATRLFSMMTLEADGDGERVAALRCEQDGQPLELPADLVLLAMGFTGPQADGVVARTDAEISRAGYATSRPGVFACGDMRRGQSLVVWAIREGRECAEAVDRHLAQRA